MLKLRKFFFTALAVCLGMMVNAQVTTSSISGSVKDQSGKLLEGAAITAIHLPSGTSYSTVSKKGGSFNIPNARIGGPYKLSVEYVGQKKYETEGFALI
ncbi:MAG: carboxypeptidase-like regulatory domain-containing protein, partial [Bacteroidota bacterium]